MAASPDALLGRTIAGKFVIEAHIGSGAMGAVYRARQVALEKTVAIKVLHGEHLGESQFVARFHREAKAASRLNHPNSMQVIDFGEEPDGLLYIAMEYLDGRSLYRVLREDRPLPAARIAEILMQTLAALAVAHDEGVVHRDLKPENIIVLSGTDDDGRPRDTVKVCDFGIAKITDARAYKSGSGDGSERESGAPVTTAGLIVGTPEYMSPEQGRGERLDPRSDLYAVGVILFEMLSGRVPFEAENALGVLLRHVTEAPPRPSQLVAGGAGAVHAGLEAVCMRALEKRRDDRYPNAREMRASIRAAVEGAGGEDVAGGVRVITATPAPGTAATVQVAAPPGVALAAAAASEDPRGKPTLVATTAAIEGPPRKRGAAVIAVVALVAAVVGVGGGLLVLRARTKGPVGASATSGSAPLTTLSAQPVSVPGDIPALDQTKGGWTAASGHGAAVGHRPTLPGAASPSSSAKVPETAASSSASAQPAASTTSSAAVAIEAPSAAAPAPAASSSAPVAATPPEDATFDPERGYVEVGLINAQGVRDRAVRAALHGLGLAGCYRRALHTRGSRAEGVATLSLSYDEKGATRGAVVTGADFLPGLARCVQGAAYQASVPGSQVDSGGGTADVTLAFKVP